MATVRLVANIRVKPGRYVELFEGLKAFKKVTGRLGAHLAVNRQISGPDTGNVFMVVQFENWAAFAKVQTDPELQGAIEAMSSSRDAAYEGITVSLNEEVEI